MSVDSSALPLTSGGGFDKKKLLLYAALAGGGIGLIVFLLKPKASTTVASTTDMLSTNAAVAMGSLQYQLLTFEGAASIWARDATNERKQINDNMQAMSGNMENGFHMLDTELDLQAGQIAQTGEAMGNLFKNLTPEQRQTFLTQWYTQLDAFRHEYDAGGGSGVAFTPLNPGAFIFESPPNTATVTPLAA